MKDFIAFIDSGLGGISILKESVKVMPNEDFLYFGDSANAPYGIKSTKEIQNIMSANVSYLLERGAKAIVIACNTATGASAKSLRLAYPDLPIVGVEPAVKPAVLNHCGGKILVMATPLTLSQGKFLRLLSQYQNMAEIISLPCPGLMEFVERGELEGEKLNIFLYTLLEKYRGDVSAAVLGCTHYPFLKKAIQNVLGDDVDIIDGSCGTSVELKNRLKKFGRLKKDDTPGKVVFENSKNSDELLSLSQKLFETEL